MHPDCARACARPEADPHPEDTPGNPHVRTRTRSRTAVTTAFLSLCHRRQRKTATDTPITRAPARGQPPREPGGLRRADDKYRDKHEAWSRGRARKVSTGLSSACLSDPLWLGRVSLVPEVAGPNPPAGCLRRKHHPAGQECLGHRWVGWCGRVLVIRSSPARWGRSVRNGRLM